jgi:hypothetical protein
MITTMLGFEELVCAKPGAVKTGRNALVASSPERIVRFMFGLMTVLAKKAVGGRIASKCDHG